MTFDWDTSDIKNGSEQELRVVVDPDDEGLEQDETNNTVTIPAWPVDLVPESLQVTDMEPGTSAELAVSVANHGSEPADETVIRLLDVTSGESDEIAELSLQSLGAGESTEERTTWDISEFDTGTTREVEAVVDPEDIVPERDESNNGAATTVELLNPLPDGYEATESTDAYFGTWDGNLVVNANGVDVWDDADQYGAIYDPDTQADTSTTVTVEVVSQENTDGWAKAGVMIRNDVTDAGNSAGYAALMITADNGIEFEWDSDADGFVDDAENVGDTTYPVWLELERDDDTFTARYSTDGSSWTEIGSVDVPGAEDVQDIAAFATSHTTSELGRVEFDQFEVQ